ncbi:MAG: hypothetical protein H6969_01180 [Gammaproteobacteria bacterium]|nr:hypothetical protein [Gammaproteobacteria bacterium]
MCQDRRWNHGTIQRRTTPMLRGGVVPPARPMQVVMIEHTGCWGPPTRQAVWKFMTVTPGQFIAFAGTDVARDYVRAGGC